MILAEHAKRPIRIERVIKMLLIHDLVEIDVGDNPIHGDHDKAAVEAIERAAADRIFGLLPPDQGEAYQDLWQEFEAAETDDAIFAKSVDRVQPAVSNLETDGGIWREFEVTEDASHASMFAECKPAAAEIAVEEGIEDPICSDGSGRSRSAIHKQLIDMVAAAFSRALKSSH